MEGFILRDVAKKIFEISGWSPIPIRFSDAFLMRLIQIMMIFVLGLMVASVLLIITIIVLIAALVLSLMSELCNMWLMSFSVYCF